MTAAEYETSERRRGARHSAIALLIGAMVWIALLASAQHHETPDPLANAAGLLAAVVMVVLAVVILARTFPKGSRK